MTVVVARPKQVEGELKTIYTPEEYLALEEKAAYKHEYRNGAIVAMAGGSTDHNEIVTNLCTALKIDLQSLKLQINMADIYGKVKL
ncbi:MAG: hypothetical protein RLZZ568_1023 [Cyanobacteriota bacterium]|jgi:Uma2 family endonuclease